MLLSDRADRYQQAELEKQAREVRVKWTRRQRRRLRYLAGRLRSDPPQFLAKLESFGERASILSDEAARRVARCHAEVRTTYHRAWRDLVKVLASDKEDGPPEFAGDDDNNKDKDKDGETVAVDEPAPLSTGTDAVPPPACGDVDDFLPDDPEKQDDRSAQLVDREETSIDLSASGSGGAKGAPSGEQTLNNPPPEVPRAGGIAGPGEGRTSGHYGATARCTRLMGKPAERRGRR